MTQLYTRRDIAEATGKTLRAITERARKGRIRQGRPIERPWSASAYETRRGQRTSLYSPKDLPRDVRAALDKWDRRQQEQAAKTTLDEFIAKTIEVERAEKLERAKVALAEAAEREKLAEREFHESRARRKRDGRAKFNRLPRTSPKYRRAQAREWLLLAGYQIRREQHLTLEASFRLLARRIETGEEPVPEFVLPYIPRLNGRAALRWETVKRWHYSYDEEGVWGLVPGYGARADQSKIDTTPELYQLVMTCIARWPHITPAKIKQFIAAEAPQLNICSATTIRRFVKRWKSQNAQLWTFLTNPDRWKNVYMAAAGSHFERVTDMHQVWEMDSTPGDWMLKDGRHSVIVVIDLWSRQTKAFVSRTSKAEAVKQLLRRAILEWRAVPECVRTDNGADYVSEAVDGTLRDLEVMHEVCIPFASEQKGTVERVIKTMMYGCLDLLDGYIGHSVAERKEIDARRSFAERIMSDGGEAELNMTAEELQEKLDQWTDKVYAHTPHEGEGMNGMTPFQRAASYTGASRAIHDERALDALLAEVAGTRTVTKKGVRFNHHYYFHEDIHLYIGKEVTLRYDESDIGRLFMYCEGEFAGVAECPELLGFSRRDAAAALKRKQAQHVRAQKRELQAAMKDLRRNPAEAIIEYYSEQSDSLVQFPRPTEAHTTPALEAAADAARHAESSGAGLDPNQYERFAASFVAREERREISENLPYTHAHWTRVRNRIEAGLITDPDLKERCAVYWSSQQAISMGNFFAEFQLTEADYPERDDG